MKKRITIFLSILTLVLFGAHYIVYLMLASSWEVFVIHNIYIRILVILLVSASFPLASIGVHGSMNKALRLFYKLSAYWIGCFVYLFLGAVLWSLLLVFFSASGVVLAQIVTLTALAVSIYGLVHARRIQTKTVEIALPNMPDIWKEKKIVMLSDLHFGAIHNKTFGKRVVDHIRKEDPDMIFIVGDFFDGVKAEEAELAQLFSPLKPKDGMYFVMGNHDEFEANAKKAHVLTEAGMIILDNEKTEIDGVQILGVDFNTTSKKYAFKNIMDTLDIDRTKPSILLRHAPTHLDVAQEAGISIVLSGHTHNGQQVPGNLVASAVHDGYGYGHKKFRGMDVLVSSGVGTWGPPLRVGSDSELLVLKFV